MGKKKKDKFLNADMYSTNDAVYEILKDCPKLYEAVELALKDRGRHITIIIRPIPIQSASSWTAPVSIQVSYYRSNYQFVKKQYELFLEWADDIGKNIKYPLFISIAYGNVMVYAIPDYEDCCDEDILCIENNETLNDFISRISKS